MHLCEATLATLGRRLDTPDYDRRALCPSIVHFGVGGFHRAHQAVYLDDLARSGELGWGETGVGLRSTRMKTALHPQDCLYTVVERTPERDVGRVIGSMRDYFYGPDDPHGVVGRLGDPRTRIVTLTVTGDGYDLDENEHDDFRQEPPRTWYGYVVAALAERRSAGLPGFTVLSCDNLPNSGAAAEAAVVSLARRYDETLAMWIQHNVTFPDSMVDRITPV